MELREKVQEIVNLAQELEKKLGAKPENSLQPPVQEGDRVEITCDTDGMCYKNGDILILGAEQMVGCDRISGVKNKNGKAMSSASIILSDYHYRILPYWTEELVKPHMWVNDGHETFYACVSGDSVWYYLRGDSVWYYLHGKNGLCHNGATGRKRLSRYLNDNNYRHATPKQIQDWMKGEK